MGLRHPIAIGDTYDHVAAARNLWDRCGPIDATHAEAYLKARAIRRCRFPALRFHPSLPYRPDEGGWRRFPALVGAVTGDDGQLQPACTAPGSIRTARPRPACRVRARRLDASTAWPCGSGRWNRPPPSWWARGSRPCSRWSPSCRTLTTRSTRPTRWRPALSAGSLGAFVPRGNVTRLIVAPDRDEEGEIASRRLQLRCTRLGIACAVLLPAGNDFNDDLRTFGAKPLAQRLAPLAGKAATGSEDSLAGRSRASSRKQGRSPATP